MATLLNDVRYAVRLLKRSPGFAITAILTLALSIGANAAIFSAVQGVLIAPLPYPDPDRLVRLFEENPTTPHFPMSPLDFRDYRAELQTFDGIAAYMRGDLQLGDVQRPEHLRGMQVSAGFFGILGYRPAFGREFEQNDELTGHDDVVMLSHALWMRRFNGDPAVIGRTVQLSGRSFRVIGVLPAGLQHVGGTYRTYGHGESIDVWAVLPVPREERAQLRYSHYFNVIGRLRPGVSRGAVLADLERARIDVAKRYPSPNSQWKAVMVPLKEEIVGTAGTTLLVLAGAAFGVLVLACVNVAGLLLGRASSRAKEIGVRAALGATEWRVARQLLIESLVLAMIGGAIGVALAYLAVAAVARFGPADMPRLQMIAVNGRVLACTAAATLTSALFFGFAPAFRLARAGLGEALKSGSRTVAGSPHQRLRRVLASAEVALAFVLVVASGLLVRSFVSMVGTDPGFRPTGVITASLELPTARYDLPASAAFFERVAERIRALPGVREAAFSSDLPWTGYDENTGFSIVGRKTSDAEGPEARYHFLTSGYTRATGTPLIAGRDFTSSDVKDAPRVILLNESAARAYWKSPEAAVGARVNLWGDERTVAGVIGDVRDMPWHDRAVPALYFPQAQMWYPQPMILIARSDVEPTTIVEPIRRALREIDPALPIASVKPLESVAGAAIATRRLTLWLVTVFGATALFLAVVGLYGVLAQAVGQRTQEFGIRQALGATRGDIMRLVFSSGVLMTVSGLLAGVALALLSTRLLASLLYQVTPLDMTTFVAVGVVLLVTSGVAGYIPARRATRVSAATSLRG
jgi:putative ABC transport system permease protein